MSGHLINKYTRGGFGPLQQEENMSQFDNLALLDDDFDNMLAYSCNITEPFQGSKGAFHNFIPEGKCFYHQRNLRKQEKLLEQRAE
jgi:hypothetical protein|tara:strand:- start:349 stop:606 length:258 start_codon:yes stop_codon:yes gene_type:complete